MSAGSGTGPAERPHRDRPARAPAAASGKRPAGPVTAARDRPRYGGREGGRRMAAGGWNLAGGQRRQRRRGRAGEEAAEGGAVLRRLQEAR